MLYTATGKPAHLGCKFLSDVSVVNSPIVVELLVITALFCFVLPAGSTTQNKAVITNNDRTIYYRLKLNSVALVRERTIPTERPPPVGEVSANFCG